MCARKFCGKRGLALLLCTALLLYTCVPLAGMTDLEQLRPDENEIADFFPIACVPGPIKTK